MIFSIINLKSLNSAPCLDSPRFSIAPNPAKETVTIKYEINESTSLVLSDLTGRVLKTVSLQKGQGAYMLDVHNLTIGSYILKAYSNSCQNCFEKLLQIVR